MKLWILRRPYLAAPHNADEGYVVRAQDETSARALIGDEKDNNRYSCNVLGEEGPPGVILKTEYFR